jgi:hypothetical protein
MNYLPLIVVFFFSPICRVFFCLTFIEFIRRPLFYEQVIELLIQHVQHRFLYSRVCRNRLSVDIVTLVLQWNLSDCTGCQNLSNLTHQGTREMCQIVQDVRTCLTRHTKGPGKCVGLYRMSEPV